MVQIILNGMSKSLMEIQEANKRKASLITVL